jgi:DNA-binding transcriptional MerR regulator/methylmalonyl-CoA mutase cobalamin-binding subunit
MTTWALGSDAADKGLSISAVERETGLSKDTLRVWERRYGFPAPGRDSNGERLYTPEEVEKLRFIKHLLDRGARPSKVVGLPMAALQSQVGSGSSTTADPPQLLEVLRLVKTHNVSRLRQQLGEMLLLQGIERFLLETAAPLNQIVGDAWMRGEIQVFEEHLYTEITQGLLRTAAASVSRANEPPRVLLTTLPGEQHTLGLLMAECMLRARGATCLMLGPQTPVGEIVSAAQAQGADVVGLSFSAAYPAHTAIDALVGLRALLPAGTEIWTGGSNPALFRRIPEGVLPMRDLAGIPDTVARWRGRHTEA